MAGLRAMSEQPHPAGTMPPSYDDAPPSGGSSRRRTVTVLVVIGAILWLVAVAIVGPKLLDRSDSAVDPNPAGDEAPPAGLADVRVYTFDSANHIEGDIDYDESPPAGGDHNSQWWECGTFSEPVRNENVVHSLEHGTVWVTYEPGTLDEAQLETISEELPQKQIISPYPGLRAPMVVTVWGRQLDLTGPDDARLAEFVAAYGDGHTAPEPFASCAGGVMDKDGSTSTSA